MQPQSITDTIIQWGVIKAQSFYHHFSRVCFMPGSVLAAVGRAAAAAKKALHRLPRAQGLLESQTLHVTLHL